MRPALISDRKLTPIALVGPDSSALLWDRLGHWAQEEDKWAEAERCFRLAYEIESAHYGYCLGTALNFLGRYAEALPLVREQAEQLQPDAMSWFQLGVASAGVAQREEAIFVCNRVLKAALREAAAGC